MLLPIMSTFKKFVIWWIMSLMWIASFATAQFDKQNTTYNPGVPGSTTLNINSTTDIETKVLWNIKVAINRVLGLLALIALIILIITWVTMLVNARDDKAVDAWYKTVKNVFIALIFIGWSWLIVSFIFWVIQVFTKQ